MIIIPLPPSFFPFIAPSSLWVPSSTDNGGTNSDGGNNYPLRGMKATPFEGGVRGLGFVAGAGLDPGVRGTVHHGLMHVTDWLPTLVAGAAGVDIGKLGRPCATCNRTVAPLDGVDQWSMLSTGGASARTEALLKFQVGDWRQCTHNGKLQCRYPGSAALRVGKWKLLHGAQAFFPGAAKCALRSGSGSSKAFPIPIPANESTPICPFGWTPPPRGDGRYGSCVRVTSGASRPAPSACRAHASHYACMIGTDRPASCTS